MTVRTQSREVRRHRTEWWVVAAWASLALLVVSGLLAAAGLL
ncbi:molybdopterin oxidoreductase [Cellulomonas dongxiuzhuiae]|uniref:Molybdopterin oxidoreductase n=1 Tax=Cellulomonas dongxiuzhuiae TaxID=2819979 RepID=A0ABX8GM86_9CELL|nr:molybdopterin oxidoreductase [Cellulomonas dongxiuzhuiae]MBO3089063.1 molybdopterin oxidoreductase [Cellulomonas dongxiuzhuiae]MBO3096619.1 molybdopterin oxidoreductase [Cellulomonas dongxiuzhuiae]QWC17000.1 molybdopterin oxidoreductase [Cellulomonas dongxiuzhuiae]